MEIIHHYMQKAYFQLFTIYLRYLLGGAFIIAAFGMGKVFRVTDLSIPQQPIQELDSIQLLFRVLSSSKLYWNFIGWSQIISGALLMTQRFAELGTLIFFWPHHQYIHDYGII